MCRWCSDVSVPSTFWPGKPEVRIFCNLYSTSALLSLSACPLSVLVSRQNLLLWNMVWIDALGTPPLANSNRFWISLYSFFRLTTFFLQAESVWNMWCLILLFQPSQLVFLVGPNSPDSFFFANGLSDSLSKASTLFQTVELVLSALILSMTAFFHLKASGFSFSSSQSLVGNLFSLSLLLCYCAVPFFFLFEINGIYSMEVVN